MQQWEYLTVRLNRQDIDGEHAMTDSISAYLNHYGQMGWELASSDWFRVGWKRSGVFGHDIYAIFKRPLTDTEGGKK